MTPTSLAPSSWHAVPADPSVSRCPRKRRPDQADPPQCHLSPLDLRPNVHALRATALLLSCAEVSSVLGRDVVLVGHSFAGVTVPRVLDLLPDRIRHVVLVSAVVPPDGSRVLDQVDPGVRDLVEQSIVGGVYHQTCEGAAAMLCNDMDEATAAPTLGRLADDSAALLSEAVDLSGYKREIPRTYVHQAAAGEVHVRPGYLALVAA